MKIEIVLQLKTQLFDKAYDIVYVEKADVNTMLHVEDSRLTAWYICLSRNTLHCENTDQ